MVGQAGEGKGCISLVNDILFLTRYVFLAGLGLNLGGKSYSFCLKKSVFFPLA